MFNYLIDLIFPYRCLVCGAYLDREYLCGRCFNALPIKKQIECVGCHRPTPLGKTCTFCQDTNALDQLFVVSDFKDHAISQLVKSFKYRFLPDLAAPLSNLAAKYIDHVAKRDHFSIVEGNPLLMPVPLHQRREYWRGFNQAELLAQLIARRYRLDREKGLIRLVQGTPQAELEDRSERISNVRGLYTCERSQLIAGRTILLIDDVCTTGATLNECARVLKQAGAQHVAALVIARG